MSDTEKCFTIVMADDDPDDCQLLADVMSESGMSHNLRFLPDGEELTDYLWMRGRYTDEKLAPRPDLVLLDLNMPKLDGREVLRQLKDDGFELRVPIVVLTTSSSKDDISFCYDMGVSAFITKPVTFRAWAELVKVLNEYWFKLIKLPSVD